MTSLIVFLAPIKGLIILISCFVFADTIFAIYATVKLKSWTSFKSSKLFNLAVKSFFYMGSILLGYLIDYFILDGSLYGVNYLISKIVCMFWVFVEVKSIDETSVKLGNKPIYEIIKDLISKAKSIKTDFNELKK